MTLSPARLAAALAVALAGAAQAESVVQPDAFEALAEGKTLHFALDGVPFGSEQFLPGRRTIWRFADQACERGAWRAEGETICFTYEAMGPICWRFLATADGYAAALVDDGVEGGLEAGFRLSLVGMDSVPLACPGPRVGS